MDYNKLHIILLLFLLLNLNNNLFSQVEISCDSLQFQQSAEKIAEAIKVIDFKPLNAKRLLEEAIEINPENAEAFYLLGTIEYNRAKKGLSQNTENFRNAEINFLNAESLFKDAYALDSSINHYAISFYLGEFYYNTKEYHVSMKYLTQYTEMNNFSCDTVLIAEEIINKINEYFNLINNPVPFSPKSIQAVSTADDEYLPYVTSDGSKIYYTHRFNRKSRFSNTPVSIEEFSFADKINPSDHSNDKYTEGKTMDTPFNQGGRDQGGISLTIDNKCLYITICTYIRTGNTSYKNCDIYSSEYIDDKWQALKKLGPNINSDYTWEGQPSITADGNGLFFASARENGFGGIDIYRSRKDQNGNWGPAQNLGNVINTAYDDKTPFIHPDSQTLYFSSNGHQGVGGFDIFYSKHLGLGRWSEPINIGYPINTDKDDLGFIVSTNGQKIYFASNSLEGKGGYDLYSANLYEEARPQQVLFVNGQLFDEFGNELGGAEVELQNVKSLKLTRGLVDTETGEYAIAMALDDSEDEFILTVKKQGYFYNSKYIKPSKKMLSNPPTTLNFEVKSIKVGTRMKLKDIYFEFNSSQINEKSRVSLENFAEFLSLNPSLHIELFGHTDNVGDIESNLKLSQNRAKAVYDYLISRNIEQERVKYTGLGESYPIASNSTKKGRDQNRRTEFVVTIK